MKKINQSVLAFLVAAILFLFFCVLSPGFRKYTTLLTLLDYSYYIMLMAIGVTFPLLTGGVDLSVGTGLICYSLAGGYLIVHCGWPAWAGILVSVAFGCGVGLLNGCLIAFLRLPPFLVTLCTGMMTRGLGSLCAKGFGISWPTAGSEGSWFRDLFKVTVGETKYPVGLLWILLLVFFMEFVRKHTKVGRYCIAIGSNREAAVLSGIRVNRYLIGTYVISGFFAGLAAIAYSAVFSTVQPGTGAGFELEAIGGAIIGGVSAAGGVGSVLGAVPGVLVVCLLKTGLPYLGLQANWQQIVTGAVLVGAVLVDIGKNKKMGEFKK